MKYVLDTNTLIYFFKRVGGVAERLLAVSPQDIGIPAVVLYELEVGIAKSNAPRKRRTQLEAFSALVSILPFDDQAAKSAAVIRAELEKNGTPIGAHDVLIAGTALAHQGVLVTRNTKEFSRVPRLVLENWYT